MIHQPRVGRNLIAAHRNHRHRFCSARYHHFGSAAHDAFGSHGNRLQSRGTEAIDGHSRDLDWKTSAQRCDASYVHALLALGHGAAQNDVFNFLGIKLWNAIERPFDRNGSHFIRTRSSQRTLIRASHGSSDGRNHNDFSHSTILLRRALVWRRGFASSSELSSAEFNSTSSLEMAHCS